ncbi:hypothetical protein THRCLA_11511 [Thraustotheca clavata]|uniref:3'-5' exonuclease domain-containing protein n=1 Tax=Thraustotheca clavata TaxID=74557 RepID=A0A1V9Y7L7_9STRA|nr:hypothetical protein THRCLA_11511 [Thraustotheca clavata]
MEFSWANEEATRDIIRDLMSKDAPLVETRLLLKPIFRWAKREPEKAFAYVLWLLQLQKHGDGEIAAQPLLQANYAINTLITASQRCGRAMEAQRAFDLLEEYDYTPDVFAYTALIDVLGRGQQADEALDTYKKMLSTDVQPNIVTFTTIIRVLSMSQTIDATYVVNVLRQARKLDKKCDPSLYTEAFETCARRKLIEIMTLVLVERKVDYGLESLGDRSIQVISQLAREPSNQSIIESWVIDQLIDPSDKERLLSISTSASITDDKYQGCLGYETPPTVRMTVIHHDINRLIERVYKGVLPTRMDFETLIHQCRKRKWREQIVLIFEAMQNLSTSGRPSDDPSKIVAPQPNVAPASSTFLAIIDAYICSHALEDAWKAFDMMDDHDIPRNQAIVRKYIRGCYLLMRDLDAAPSPVEWHVLDVVKVALRDNITISPKVASYILRLYGLHAEDGIAMINILSTAYSELSEIILYDELIQACIYANNSSGARTALNSLRRKHGISTTSTIERVMLLSCVDFPTLPEALENLKQLQSDGDLVAIPVYSSLLREFYTKYAAKTHAMDASGRSKCLKVLFEKRALFDQIANSAEILSNFAPPDTTICGTMWCVQIENLQCAPILFAQNATEHLTSVRDKAAKLLAEKEINEALNSMADSNLFLLKAILAFPAIDIGFRIQAKFAKLLFGMITKQHEDHHLNYCIDHLDEMPIHLAAELDKVFDFCEYNVERVVEYCRRASIEDNVEKTMNFIMNHECFFTEKVATELAVHFAELYAQGIITGVRYLREGAKLSTLIPMVFLKALESYLNEYEELKVTDVQVLVIEFKLQDSFKELMEIKPTYTRRAFVVDPNREYYKLPLSQEAIIFVDSDEKAVFAREILDKSPLVGIDVEWRPDAHAKMKSKCSVVQLACKTHVFILDVLLHWSSEMQVLVDTVVNNPTCWKIGFGLAQDVQRLKWSFPDATCFEYDEWESVLDMQVYYCKQFKRNQVGLSRCIEDTLSLPLNKSHQTSNWEDRPLSYEQLLYAANDAYCLLQLVCALKPSQIPFQNLI